MRPPVTMIPGISADWHAIGKAMPAANDQSIGRAPVAAELESRDGRGKVSPLKTPPTEPPAGRR